MLLSLANVFLQYSQTKLIVVFYALQCSLSKTRLAKDDPRESHAYSWQDTVHLLEDKLHLVQTAMECFSNESHRLFQFCSETNQILVHRCNNLFHALRY